MVDLMRRLAVSTALLALAAVPTVAQTAALGLKAGYSRSSLSAEGADESVSGFTAGVEFDLASGGTLGGRFGGSYVRKGGAGMVEEGVEGVLDLGYFQLSGLATLAVLGGDEFSADAMFGPWVAVRVSCDASVSAAGFSIGTSCDEEFNDGGGKALDFGVALGASVGFPLSGGTRAGFDALYSLGIAPDVDGGESSTRNLAVRAGVSFPFG